MFKLSNLENDIIKLKGLINKKEFTKIEKLSKSLLIKHPESYEINFITGTSYLADKKAISGLPLLLKANKINPSSSICLFNISICYKQLKNLPQYKKYLDLAHFSDPNNLEIICELGFFHLYTNETQTSISYYENALKYKINDTNFILNLSQSYLKFGRSHNVIEICLQYIKNGNIDSKVFNTLAIAYKNIGDFINAKLYLENAIELLSLIHI